MESWANFQGLTLSSSDSLVFVLLYCYLYCCCVLFLRLKFFITDVYSINNYCQIKSTLLVAIIIFLKLTMYLFNHVIMFFLNLVMYNFIYTLTFFKNYNNLKIFHYECYRRLRVIQLMKM